MNFFFLLLFSLFFSQENFSQCGKIENSAFQVGEKLIFDISYGFITAGESIMEIPSTEILNDNMCFKISVEVKTNSSFDWFYKVRDSYLSYVDVDGIFSHKFEQHIKEGRYKRDFSATFNYTKKIAIISKKNIDIDKCIHDIISAFYFMRTLDFSNLKKNDVIHLKNFYKDSTYDLDVKFLGKEKIKIDIGEFNCIKIEPFVTEGGLFKNTGTITIWLSDDANKIPIKMSSKVVIGSIDAELKKYYGIKSELKSKLK